MDAPRLGIYVHTHWAYRHPYAARTWTLADWRGFLSGLRGLGFDTVQIWPMLDTMPHPLTASDRRHLARLARVIDMAHGDFGMRVVVGACANTVGNERSAGFAFEDRPYFVTERKLNPADPAEVEELFARRREALKPLSRADGFWVIDSDPGGYEGSPPEDFVMLLGRYRRLLDQLRPGIELVYWVWWGWNSGREAAWRIALAGLKGLDPEPWSLLLCLPEHLPVAEEQGLAERAASFRYGAIENEPSMPWTRHDPEGLFRSLSAVRCPRGAQGNAQTHPVQLPHLYYFSHFARGGTPADADLDGFAERLLPGCGRPIAAAFRAMGDAPVEAIEAAAAAIEGLRPGEAGDLKGLLFGSAERFLGDLRAQLRLRRAEKRLELARGADEIRQALRGMAEPLDGWVARHGFNDYGWQTPVARIGTACEAIGAVDIVVLFRLGRTEQHRHGFMARLLEAMRKL